MFLLTSYKVIFSITAFGALVLSLSVLLKGTSRTKVDAFFGLLMGSFIIWAGGRLGLLLSLDLGQATLWTTILYVGSILVHLFYLHFILIFLEQEKRYRLILVFFYISGSILLIANIYDYFSGSHLFISGLGPILDFKHFEMAGPLYSLHLVNYICIPTIALVLMLLSLKRLQGEQLSRLKMVIFASTLGFFGGNSVVPLVYGIKLQPYLLFLIPFYLIILSYAIRRYSLFNFKIIATELLLFVLWIFLLVRALLAVTLTDRIMDGVLFVSTVLVGVLLIRSVLKEVKTRESMEVLARELAVANERLTLLDQQKSEFLSIASHQLRSPLTAIKGYSSMLLEGSFGKIEDKVKEAIERIFLSSERLVIIVEDFLNVSRIEQGRMQYEFSSVKLDELVTGVIEELKQNAQKAHLDVDFRRKSQGPFYITADFGKVRQMVTNIIDNAIKYTPEGGIKIDIDKDDETNRVLLTIMDTGIGIAKEVLPTLFQKFTRARGAGLVNTQGTGLGLYVVKEMMKAHKGNVWVNSPGLGKGSTFYLEFMGE